MRLSLSNRVIDTFIEHARKGYNLNYKKEVGGHLLGFGDEGSFYVSRATPYHTPLRSRTWWGPNLRLFEERGRELETGRLKWIGVYHSHVEEKGKASTKQSGEDKVIHKFSTRPIEIVVRVANFRMRTPKCCLSLDEYYDEYNEESEYFSYNEKGYSYDICGYIIDSRGKIKKVKVIKAQW